MFSDMPSLTENQAPEPPKLNQKDDLSFQNLTKLAFDATNQVRHNFEGISETFGFHIQNKDNLDDINEFMVACSKVKNAKKEPSGAEKKRAKLRREFVANLMMATPDDAMAQNQKEESFAVAFFDKLKRTLTPEDYTKLMEIMSNYDEQTGDFLDFFNNVQLILLPKYYELAEEFLLFLTEIQAHKVGQLMPYFAMKDMDRFMKKLKMYFNHQPTHLKKIIKCLTDLSEMPDVTIETVKNSVLPLLKGNAALTDWFLQLFPTERPPNILSNRPHEVMDMSKELARLPNGDIYETVVLPDTDDPYGGPTCVCTCHDVDHPQFKTRSQHCIRCGLKFIQGKIYIQTGKALRPAVVSFLTNPEKDHTKRLCVTAQRKRSEISPNKHVTSPNKENQTHEDNRHSNESEEEGDASKKKSRVAKRQRKQKGKDAATKETDKAKLCDKNAKTGKKGSKRVSKKRVTTRKSPEHKPGSELGQVKRLAEEEIDFSEPAELIELKVSSDHSGESETEFFESSQDVTNTDSEDSSCSNNPAASQPQLNDVAKPTTWGRDEDNIILQAFRQSMDNEDLLKNITSVLKTRTVADIKNRFDRLMSLLQEVTLNITT